MKFTEDETDEIQLSIEKGYRTETLERGRMPSRLQNLKLTRFESA